VATVTAGWPERPLYGRESPREQLKREFILSGELRGHSANEPIRFAAALSEMEDAEQLDTSRPLDPDVISPASEPRGLWARISRRRA
jgi:hypothetical protein